METEEKELLLKDLCARLPYGVKFKANNEECIREVHYIRDENVYVREYRNLPYWIDTIKAYLRPMSSMTEEEREELSCYENSIQRADFYYSHHIDCRFMIEKGLALEALEEMYNTKEK